MKKQMKPKKRNGFWTFWFSFVPGCAEMYWGFMQAGVSLLIPFTGLIFLAYLMNMDELMFLDVIVYIYAFFHARNMAHLTEEEVSAMEDGSVNLLAGIGVTFETLRRRSVAKLAGLLLIAFGVYEVLWTFYISIPFPDWLNRYARDFLRSFPKGATAVLLIVLGVKLITGKKQELDRVFEDEKKATEKVTVEKAPSEAAEQAAVEKASSETAVKSATDKAAPEEKEQTVAKAEELTAKVGTETVEKAQESEAQHE